MNSIKEYKEEIVMIASTLILLCLMLWAFSQQSSNPQFTRSIGAFIVDLLVRSVFILLKLVGF